MISEETREAIMNEIHEKAECYGAGRSMALSFKPLTIQDVIDAYNNGAEDLMQLINN